MIIPNQKNPIGKHQINPGQGKVTFWSPSYAIEGLKEIIRVLDANPDAWQSIASRKDRTPAVNILLERARSQKLDVWDHLGDSPQILVISPSKVPMLADKLEAAIQAVGALKRQAPDHVFDASVLYPEGSIAIIATPQGRRKIAHCRELLAALSRQEVFSHH